MDLTTQTYYEPPPPQSFSSQGDVVPTTQGMMMKNSGCYRTNKGGGGGGHPIAEALLCELNLKETCDFVKAFPMTNNNNNNNNSNSNGGGGAFLKVLAERIRRQGADCVTTTGSSVEAPPTPGRPIFSFSNNTVGKTRNYNFPSKWDDAQKWLINCADSPPPPPPQHPPAMLSRQYSYRNNNNNKSQLQTPPPQLSLDHRDSVKAFDGDHVLLLKDKLTTDEEEPKFRCLEPTKQGYLFGDSADVDILKHRDTGTEMTPLGSSTTSRCHTPFKSSSPARHNTPENRSGPLALTTSSSTIDIAQFEESCHRAKLQLGGTHNYDSITSNWSSREEEEEEISKSLRHIEMGTDFRKSVSDLKAFQWEEEEEEEEENTKCCLRYQREEAKIQAWVNLENAKAEAQSRKLEVKIQRLRSNLEEKLMKRMGIVHRKAEELRAAAKLQHGQKTQKPTGQGRKMMHTQNPQSSCGCVQTIIHKTRK